MYLGRTTGLFRAQDDLAIQASAPAAVKRREVSKTSVKPVAKLQDVTESTPIQPSRDPAVESELRNEVSRQRGRIRGLLKLLSSKNKEIARKDAEIAALREPEQLTVDQILAAKAPSKARA